jgi:hypothetical protein
MRVIILLLLYAAASSVLWAQGPPITLDKPIMLGQNKGTFRPMLKIVNNSIIDFNALILDADYNLSNKFALAIEAPLIFPNEVSGARFGDVGVSAKYQFLRVDGVGKTLRIAAKARNMFRTGIHEDTPILGMGHNMTYLGVLAAREALKLGIQAELGYNMAAGTAHLDHLLYKLGFGIPLLKPVYPVNQLNLYCEFEGMNLPKHLGINQYGYYYAQGLQYARGVYTFDFSVQFPLSQQFHGVGTFERRVWTLIGTRVVI